MVTKVLRAFVAGMALLTVAGLVWADADARSVVQGTADQVLAEVKGRKAELLANPQKIYPLVDQLVLPRFDFERMSQLVLGRYWPSASAEQRSSFVTHFRELLVNTYASALLNYSNQEIRYKPVRPSQNPEDVQVDTEVNEPGGPTIPISYSLMLKNGTWLVYDVKIDGVSLVANYRSSFANQIRREGLDGLIQSLQNHTAGQ